MTSTYQSYSPHIVIYLEVGEKKIRLSDVLYNSATVYESSEFPPETKAALVFSINGVEEREEVILQDGMNAEESRVTFTYADPARINGRKFPA